MREEIYRRLLVRFANPDNELSGLRVREGTVARRSTATLEALRYER